MNNTHIRTLLRFAHSVIAVAFGMTAWGQSSHNLFPRAGGKRGVDPMIGRNLEIQIKSALASGDLSTAHRKAESLDALVGTDDSKRLLAEVLLREGQSGRALTLETILNARYHDEFSNARIGFLLCRQGRTRESVKRFDRGRFQSYCDSPDFRLWAPQPKTSRELEGAWLMLIGVQEDQVANDEAAAYYLEAAERELRPNALIARALGDVYRRHGEYVQAIDELSIAVRLGSGKLKRDAQAKLSMAKSAMRRHQGTPSR